MAMVPQGSGPMIPTNGTATMTETAAGRSYALSAETNQAALAAQATAQVQARYIMADRRPRSWDNVRVKILAECQRPGFARVARYLKPIGKGVAGPSIRFAEACLRYAGNMSVDTLPVYEDRHKRVLALSAIDYETNAAYSATVTIPKTVERRQSKDRVVVSQRTNSYGDVVYIVEATEDELLNQQNALISKAARTLILRLVPGDIVEEAQALCVEVSKHEDAKDPRAAQKRMTDAFAALGVMPSEIEKYLGHPFAAITADEGADLKAIHEAIRDGETTWTAVMESKFGESKSEKSAPAAQAKGVVEKLRNRNAAKAAGANPDTGELPHTPASDPKVEREPGDD